MEFKTRETVPGCHIFSELCFTSMVKLIKKWNMYRLKALSQHWMSLNKVINLPCISLFLRDKFSINWYLNDAIYVIATSNHWCKNLYLSYIFNHSCLWSMLQEIYFNRHMHAWCTAINQTLTTLYSKTPHVVTVLWLASDDVVTILSPTSGTSGRLQNRVSVPPWFLHSDSV